ncbi:DUF2169 domain-containing protein [Caballeronia sp. GAWG2-1]|uniref:DUF2169 family type VI secretion system accessory protein n=1 Tax=Caballeronia sp. GAWG2-1 TaxID=2921744 RepID=UPI002027C48A|nr:DUF2169 domain-containing protein [Caballeronia sp. GAWG2-1]
MKILKPDTAGLVYRTLRFNERDLLSMGVLVMFALDAPHDGPPRLASEPDLWKAGAGATGDGPLDAGFPKPCGEWLAYGAAHAPAGTTATLVETTVQVGASRKSLFVYGDRRFGPLGTISAPEPFHRMPLDATRAFGGPEHAANPAGRGAVFAGDSDRVLPNVETPDALIASPSDVREPAGYWALPATSPQRTALLGAFDDDWLAKQWPHLPADTRTDYFCTAPHDQRIAGFWQGDERIVVDYMHPDQPHLAARLPALRARCFVTRRIAGDMRFEECAARPETVWILPEIGQGIVLYRAVAALGDEDADDIAQLMVDFESMTSAPLPAEYYRDRLQARLSLTPPVPAAASASPAPAAAVATPPALKAPDAPDAPAVAGPSDPAAFAELESLTAQIESTTQNLLSKHGMQASELEAHLPQAGTPPFDIKSGGDAASMQRDLQSLTQTLESSAADLMKRYELTPADVEKLTAPVLGANGASAPADAATLAGQLRAAFAQTQQALAARGSSITGLAAQVTDPETVAALNEAASIDFESIVGALSTLGASTTAAAPATQPPASAVLGVPQPPLPLRLNRDDVIARAAAGHSLASLNLSGLDLSGAMLERADLRLAVLNDVRLTGARLSGTDLSGAMLAGADLVGAQLHDAKLDNVSARNANFGGAQLQRASLSASDFADADFSAANLEGAQLARAIFSNAKMMGVKASRCGAAKASFSRAVLAGADFTGANLANAVFDHASIAGASFVDADCSVLRLFGTQGAGARFDNANLSQSRAGLAANLSGASFVGARLNAAVWLDIDISQANFDQSALDHVNFSGVIARGARFVNARAVSIRLSKADLSGADFSRANLMNANLRRARLDGVRFVSSNLYGAQCYGSTVGNSVLDGANVDRTLLQIPGRVEGEVRL